MTQLDDMGDLSIISALDRRAKLEPESIWVSIPKDNNDLSRGFRDISYKQFANAVEYASAWLDGALGSGEERIHAVRRPIMRTASALATVSDSCTNWTTDSIHGL